MAYNCCMPIITLVNDLELYMQLYLFYSRVAPMRAATLLAVMGVSRPIYHLIISNEAILIVLII